MIDLFKDFPICVNCKFYIEEKTGPLSIAQTCGLTMVNPVNGDYQESRARVKLAAAFRKDGMPCGVSGKFFKPADKKKKVEPKKKPVKVVEEVKKVAPTVKVEVPEIKEEPKKDDLLPLEPGQKRRRRRAKS